MSTKTTIQRPSEFKPTGVIDGKHYFFKCSNCRAPLADIWVNYPDDNIEWKFRADCCHCGDKSYEQIIKGAFALGHSEESQKYTSLDAIDVDENDNTLLIIRTKQVKPYVS